MNNYHELVSLIRSTAVDAVSQTFDSDQLPTFGLHLSVEGTKEEPTLTVLVTLGGTVALSSLMAVASLMTQVHHRVTDTWPGINIYERPEASFEPYTEETHRGLIPILSYGVGHDPQEPEDPQEA